MALKTSGPATRSRTYSAHISSVQAWVPARAIGVMPFALKVSTTVSSSSHVVGGFAPASVKTFLLKNSSTGCMPRIGTP
jgi:hypothetical protein